jgi:hypothetical protein
MLTRRKNQRRGWMFAAREDLGMNCRYLGREEGENKEREGKECG